MALRDAGVRLIDCVHKTPTARDSGNPYVTIPQMKNGKIDFEGARLISQEDFVEWTRKAKPRLHDVVLSRRTNPGVTATFGDRVDFALGQNLVLLRADGQHVAPPFLRWLTSSPAWWGQISKFINVGAVFDSLRCADVPRFELPIPPLHQQRAISALLDALDDKVDLNRRMNETLEEMANAIFDDWFVNFGPVRRKLEGASDPVQIIGGIVADRTQAQQIAALFPSTLASGDLPEGWSRSSLLEFGMLVSGGTPKTDRHDYWGGPIGWASAKDVSQCGDVFLLETERTITAAGLENSSTKIVPREATVVVARGATTGRCCMFGRDLAMNQTCYALVSRTGHPFWLNAMFKTVVEQLVQTAHGSVFDTITTSTFANAAFARAPEPVMTSFERIARSLFERILAAQLEISRLTEMRDFLLPRLMSGEVTVRTAEAVAA